MDKSKRVVSLVGENNDIYRNCYKQYNNGEINIRVFSPQRSILKGLDSYLSAHLSTECLPGTKTWEIVVSRKKEDFLYLLQNLKDGKKNNYYVEESGTLTVRKSREYKCILVCNPNMTSFFQFVQDIYCAIRRISMRSLGEFVTLHASACHLKGKTLFFLGEKGTGKSLITDYFLLEHDAEYIAADQVVLYRKGSELFCRGNITSYRAWMQNNYMSKEYTEYHKLHSYAKKMIDIDERIINGKINFPPKVISEILKKRILIQSKPDILVFLDKGKTYTGICRLTNLEVEDLLKRNVVQDAYKDYICNEYEIKDKIENEKKLIKQTQSKCYCVKMGRVNINFVRESVNDIIRIIEGECVNEKHRN